MTTTWRNYLKQRSFALLNVAGLTIGITCLLAILLYVTDEFEFDRYNKNAERIFRVNTITDFGAQKSRYATSSTPLAEAIRSDIPEAEGVARLFQRQATIQLTDTDGRLAGQKYLEDNFYFADTDLFRMLTFTFIKGDARFSPNDTHQLFVSHRIAVKYFGSVDDAVGKQIQLEGTIPLEIRGVFEDLPGQSSYPIELIAHFENYFAVEPDFVREFLRKDWLYGPVTTLLLLKHGANKDAVQQKIQDLNARYADERVQKNVTYELQKLLSIHLHSAISYTADQNAIQRVYVILSAGILILLIACINFINLSTVWSLKRAKEIGIRKVMGAVKTNIAVQFLLESSALVLLSLVLSILLVLMMLPQVNLLSGKLLTVESLLDNKIVILLAVIFLFTSLAAGLYPSFSIARLSPIKALRGPSSGGRGTLLQRALIVIQFASSVILIISTVVMYKQMEYIQQRPLGFQKDHMLTIPIFSDNMNSTLGGGVGSDLRGRMNSFENEVLKFPAIEAIAASAVLPGQSTVSALVKTDAIKETDNVFIPVASVDYDFLETYKMQLLAGRNFNKLTGTDHLQALIANEEAIKLLGYQLPENAIGQEIEVLGKKATIVGVVSNYNFEGLQQVIRPLLLEVNVSKFMYFSVRLSNQKIPESIEIVKTHWDSFFPEKVFTYTFLDAELQNTYEAEQRFGNLIKFFSVLAILISSLGLFGLSAYMGHQKQKEAGVRKVLGANTIHVYYTFSRQYILMLIIATLIATPIGYFLAEKWLNNFAFHAPIDGLPVAVSFACTTAAVIIATSFQTLKAAKTNPVVVLRTE